MLTIISYNFTFLQGVNSKATSFSLSTTVICALPCKYKQGPAHSQPPLSAGIAVDGHAAEESHVGCKLGRMSKQVLHPSPNPSA